MSTKTKKSRKIAENEEKPQRLQAFTREDILKAVQKAFVKVEGRIDVRYLWGDDGLHRFRVNCWKNSVIHHSEFVIVDEFIEEDQEDSQPIVRRSHGK